MIYCGYQGCGKTTYCRNNPTTTVDLDSSAFAKVTNWEQTYVETALALSENKKVFISAHQEVIEYCMKNDIAFTILAPAYDKEVWRARLEFRYRKNSTLGNLKALMDFEQNFEKDINYYKSLVAQGVRVHWVEAKIITTIESNL